MGGLPCRWSGGWVVELAGTVVHDHGDNTDLDHIVASPSFLIKSNFATKSLRKQSYLMPLRRNFNLNINRK